MSKDIVNIHRYDHLRCVNHFMGLFKIDPTTLNVQMDLEFHNFVTQSVNGVKRWILCAGTYYPLITPCFCNLNSRQAILCFVTVGNDRPSKLLNKDLSKKVIEMWWNLFNGSTDQHDVVRFRFIRLYAGIEFISNFFSILKMRNYA